MRSFIPDAGVPIPKVWNYQRASAEEVTVDGYWLEFGVYDGASISRLVTLHTPVYGFDCFTGLPEAWHVHPAGYFNRKGKPPVVEGAEFVVGLFQDTLPDWLTAHSGPVALLHVDSDLYSSAEFVLRTLREAGRIVPGTVIMFDEYGLTDDEQRAASEQLEPYFTAEPLFSCSGRDSFKIKQT